ncbi:MAG: hypothetical protein DRJ03_16890 [Chloroflexi bacterium]|nr:MAG: hypothetical protein DRJ03_16890 [Chloroflexota bacterium]
MIKQLPTKEEATGKTVAKIVVSSHPEYLAIHFTDGTAYVVEAEEDYDGTPIFVPPSEITEDHILLSLELITDEEHALRWQKEVASRELRKEKEERKQYEKLKAKYGEGGEEV